MRLKSRTLLCLLAWFLPGPVLSKAFAQTNMAGHVMEMQDEIPPERLPPAVLISGAGNAHMEITATPEAQLWFDQGLNLLHDFWDYESARAFQQGIRVDPKCAMCFWGLYKAESFYHSTTQGFAGKALTQAAALKENISERERLYIDAAVAQEHEAAGIEAGSHYSREQELLRKLVADYPHDSQARIFLANTGGGDSLAILESVLKDEPESSAANHYYIHALEASDHPEKALHSADILGRLAPGSGHTVHMPGHIYFRVGDYARAASVFAASLAVDERYMREHQVEPDNNWNYVHNLMYSVANLLEQGKFDEATRLSGKIAGARGKLETTLYINSARDSMSRLDPRLPVAMRTGDFDQILTLVKASSILPGLQNLEFLRQRLVDFATGMKAVAARNLHNAEKLSLRFDAELWRVSQERKKSSPMHDMAKTPSGTSPPRLAVMSDALIDPLLRTLSILSLELRASLLAAQGHPEDARVLFARAIGEEKALGYHEPPNYIRPVGESEGAAMLAARKWADAEVAFQRARGERPNSGFALYGIALARELAGDKKAAVKSYADFLTAWTDADANIAQIARARAYVARHKE